MRSTLLQALATAVILLVSNAATAFDISGSKWLRAKADFYVDMEGISGTQISWNDAFIAAMNAWSEQSIFDFTLVEENFDPCLVDGRSSVDFAANYCGTEFGSNTLAITVRRFAGQTLGPNRITEADIIVNDSIEFNVYDGPLVQFGIPGLDFGRVALHELGHVIGLDHESSNKAIMAPSIGNLFELQEDDINGVTALYSGLDACEVKLLAFGASSNGLGGNDCTVRELTVGGTDESFLDLYQFQIGQATDFEFNVESDVLDAVLIIATTDLEFLALDFDASDQCGSSLKTSLDPGSYFLIVNTFDEPVKDDCGVTGTYKLRADYSASGKPSMGTSTSLLGSTNLARYSGGISKDGGVTYSNVFTPDDSLQIEAEITTDIRHRGKDGFLVVAALLENQILMLNEQGEFVEVGLNPDPIVRFASKPLQAIEPLSIATDLVPGALGIDEIEANIVVGYGLDSDPQDIFYHLVPLNLTVRPLVSGGG
jgi:predicted Zn-dependent protease